MSKEAGIFLGNFVGSVVEIDTGSSGSYMGKYLRVRVEVDITKALRIGIRVLMGDPEEEVVVALRVETGFIVSKGISEGGTSMAQNEGEVFDSIVVKGRVELKRNICPGVDTSDDRSSVGEVKETDSFEFTSGGGASSFSSEGELSSIQHLEASEVCSLKQKKWKRMARAKGKMSLGGRLELVQRCFDPEEANMILGIPLSLNPRLDSYCWNFDRNGFFSVKSAYRLALNLQGSGVALSSNGPHFLWKFLWNLNLPSKIKILSWKACKEIIPTRALLAKRVLLIMEIVCCVVMVGRTRRNLFVHDSVCLSTDNVWSKAVAYVQDFDVAYAQKAPPSVSSGSGLQCWVPPPPDVFKLNVDAAFDKLNGKIGLGMVVRNAGGDVVLAAALSFKGGTSVVVGEAQAVLEGILLAGNRGHASLSQLSSFMYCCYFLIQK
ncbi:hypothetical protein ACOSQ3_031926 [Xanthoceras sorbifolium]